MEFYLTGQQGERGRFVEAFEDFCQRHRVPDFARQAADLALEEHLTNVLAYGFDNGKEPWIAVRLTVKDKALIAQVTDTGKAYDPLSVPPVDAGLTLEDRPIGGLGVHLMRTSMDQLFYSREGQKNVLQMIKALAA